MNFVQAGTGHGGPGQGHAAVEGLGHQPHRRCDRLVLNDIRALPVIRPLRAYDRRAWPHAPAGFFKFKAKIPEFVGAMKALQPV